MLGQFGDVDGSARGTGMWRWGNPSAEDCQKTVKMSMWEKQFSREQEQPSARLKRHQISQSQHGKHKCFAKGPNTDLGITKSTLSTALKHLTENQGCEFTGSDDALPGQGMLPHHCHIKQQAQL